MYNLLVTSTDGAWERASPTYYYAPNRFLQEYTEPGLLLRFQLLQAETIAELCSIPTLFVYELDLNKPESFIGRITNISQTSGGVTLTFEIDRSAPRISRENLLRMQITLGISDPNEINRTHWALKDIDLIKVIKSVYPSYSEQRSPTVDASRYRIESCLGEGGQALVSKATDLLLGRPVAIKSLEPFFGVAPSARDRERLRREARALATLSHPNIPAVYDIQLDVFPPRIIFEFIDGSNLLKVLQLRKPSLREVCRWLLQVCSALAHAHQRGVIHRDLKPANIVLKLQEGTCYLVDFGLAAISDEALRTSSKFAGTTAYMAPEQHRGEDLDGRADLYSLGVTMYQLLANKLPRPESYEPLSAIDPSIPHDLDVLIQDCLRARENRPVSVDDFVRRLRDAVAVSLSMSEVLEHGNLLQRVIESLETASPDNIAGILDDIRRLRTRLVRLQSLVEDGQVSLPELGVTAGTSIDSVIIPLEEAVKKFKRQYVAEALERFRGNRTQAAKALDVNVRTVFRFLADGEDDGQDGRA